MLLWLIQESLDALEIGGAEHCAPRRAMVVRIKSRLAALTLASFTAPPMGALAPGSELGRKDIEQLGYVSCSTSSVVERLVWRRRVSYCGVVM